MHCYSCSRVRVINSILYSKQCTATRVLVYVYIYKGSASRAADAARYARASKGVQKRPIHGVVQAPRLANAKRFMVQQGNGGLDMHAKHARGAQ